MAFINYYIDKPFSPDVAKEKLKYYGLETHRLKNKAKAIGGVL